MFKYFKKNALIIFLVLSIFTSFFINNTSIVLAEDNNVHLVLDTKNINNLPNNFRTTSDLEGFGLAIAEARMLNKPVVTTRFDAVFNQMIHEKNGLVVDMNSEAVFNGIMRLINDESLRKNIIKYLENEKKGNVEEIDKFYKLIES